jgi:hypothetical protein
MTAQVSRNKIMSVFDGLVTTTGTGKIISSSATHFNAASVRLRRAADAKMTVFMRASVCVWGLLQRADAFFFSLFSIKHSFKILLHFET